MTSPTFRRLRGVFGLAATWAVAWAIAAGLTGGITSALILWIRGAPAPVVLLIAAFAVAGAISGFVSGAGFALLLTTSAHRRTLGDLNPIQFGVLGAVPAALFGWLLFRQAGLALIATGFGFLAATGSLVLARRANARELESGSGSLWIESGSDR
jgi:hypothetical protein